MSDSLVHLLGEKNALDELLSTQAMALDLCDWATYRRCFTDVIRFDFVEHIERVIGGSAEVITDPNQWIEMSRAVIPGFDSTMHVVSGTIHRIEGDRASSRCYLTADHFLSDAGADRSITVGGIYHVDFARTVGSWKISGLRLQVLFYRGDSTLYQRAADRVLAKEVQAMKRDGRL